jgi:hypothetical protein
LPSPGFAATRHQFIGRDPLAFAEKHFDAGGVAGIEPGEIGICSYYVGARIHDLYHSFEGLRRTRGQYRDARLRIYSQSGGGEVSRVWVGFRRYFRACAIASESWPAWNGFCTNPWTPSSNSSCAAPSRLYPVDSTARNLGLMAFIFS